MKILVYGAGVIGSIFALKLKKGGNDVTVLARGRRLEQIRKYGIIVKDVIFNQQYETDIKTTSELKPDDYYDLALVIMQRQQVSDILPVLKRNNKIPTFIFMGNNVNGADEYLKFLDKSRVMLGFGGQGGYREDHFVIATYVKDYCILYFGELDGVVSSRVEKIRDIFKESEINVIIPESIDAWLKSHAALISPLAMASYAARNKNKRIVDDDKLLTLSIKALKENLRALKEIGIAILPGKLGMMKVIPTFILKRKLKNLIASEFGRVALSGHANSARNEMIRISEDFRGLVKDVRTDMSANDFLYKKCFGNENPLIIKGCH